MNTFGNEETNNSQGHRRGAGHLDSSEGKRGRSGRKSNSKGGARSPHGASLRRKYSSNKFPAVSNRGGMTLDGGEDDPLLLFQPHQANRTMIAYQGSGVGNRRNSGGGSAYRHHHSKTPSANSRRSRPLSKSPISLRLRDDSRNENNLQLI